MCGWRRDPVSGVELVLPVLGRDPEPMPEPFGVVWERRWKQRQRDGENKLIALVRSWLDVRSISRMAR